MLASMVLFGYIVAPVSLILHRLLRGVSGWLLAIFPLTQLLLFALQIGSVSSGTPLVEHYTWVDELGVQVSFVLDGVSLLFALLVTLASVCTLIFTGYALAGDSTAGLFLCFLLLCTSSMLGVVLAANTLTIACFWMVLAISSCALIGYQADHPAMQHHISRAATISIGGALVLLMGVVLLSEARGAEYGAGAAFYTFDTLLLATPAQDTMGALLTPALLLIAVGCATASALFPFHLWLSSTIDAPSPARAFLHSAGMGLAGIYLLTRLVPLLNGSTATAYLLVVLGGVTLLIGAVSALHQNDRRAVLAYSSVSHAGLLAMVAGAGGAAAPAALVAGALSHALATAALLLLARVIDFAAGTGDMNHTGGLRRVLPATMVMTILSAVSLTGTPFLIGFVSRRMAFETVLTSPLPAAVRYSLLIVAALGTAIGIAAMVRMVRCTFFGAHQEERPRKPPIGMLIAPGIVTLLLLVLSVPVVGLANVSRLLTPAATAAANEPVAVTMSLWSGMLVPALALGAAVGLGILLALVEPQIVPPIAKLSSYLRVERVYRAISSMVLGASTAATRMLQRGKLQTYIATTLMLWLGLIGSMFILMGLEEVTLPSYDTILADVFSYEMMVMLPIPFGVAAAILARSRIDTVVAVGAVSISVMVLLMLFSAPGAAIVLILVHVLSLTLIALVFAPASALPKKRALPGIHIRDGIIAVSAGVLITMLTLVAATSQAFPPVSSFYIEQSIARTGTENVVNALMTNFRGFDMMGLVILLFLAMLGSYGLFGVREVEVPDLSRRTVVYDSLLFQSMATLMFPPLLIIGLALMLRGYAAPGGGLAGGLLIAAAIIMQAMAFNPRVLRRLFPVNYLVVTLVGILVAAVCGMMSLAVGLPFLTALWQELPVIGRISTPLLFDVSTALIICGVTVQIALLLLREMKQQP